MDMTDTPSIKGSIVATHAEILRKALDETPVDERVLQERFEPGELDMLREPIESTRWYSIETYRRMMEFLRDHVGDGDVQYLVDAGRRSADNLIRAGIHQQLEYLKRTQHNESTDARERFQAFGRDLRLLVSITGSILNFADSSVVEDPDTPNRWIIQHKSASAYPEILCWTSQGFCNRMAEEHGGAADLWYWERPRQDTVIFRMKREV
jgi:hypothetical protein